MTSVGEPAAESPVLSSRRSPAKKKSPAPEEPTREASPRPRASPTKTRPKFVGLASPRVTSLSCSSSAISLEQPPFYVGPAAHKSWPTAEAVVARGPVLESPVRADSRDLWFELLPAAGGQNVPKGARLDTAHVTFSMRLTYGAEVPLRTMGKTVKTTFSFTPVPPSATKLHGSIHVLLSSLRAAGTYVLHVMHGGSYIHRSPCRIEVLPGPPAQLRFFGHRPVVDGGLAKQGGPMRIVLTAGKPRTLLLRAYDEFGNLCAAGEGVVEVQLRDSSGVRCTIHGGRDDSYELTAAAEVEGSHECRVVLLRAASAASTSPAAGGSDRRPNPSSSRPLAREIVHEVRLLFAVTPAELNPASCRLVGFPASLQAGEECAFKIEARDACGNRVPRGLADWQLLLMRRGSAAASEASADETNSNDSSALRPTLWEVVDAGDGTCEARLMCKVAGSFEVVLVPAKGELVAGGADAVAREDALVYELDVRPAPPLPVDKGGWSLGGRGMLCAVAGQLSQATLELRDPYGNLAPGPPAEEVARSLQLRAFFKGAGGTVQSASGRLAAAPSLEPGHKPLALPFELSACTGTPGCYSVNFRVTRAGSYRVEGCMDGQTLHAPSAPLLVRHGELSTEQCMLVSLASSASPPPARCPAGNMWQARLLLQDALGNPVPLGRRKVTGTLVSGTMGTALMRSGASLSSGCLPPGAAAVPLVIQKDHRASELTLQVRPPVAGRHCCCVWVSGIAVPAAFVWVDVVASLPSARTSTLSTKLEGAEMRVLVPMVFQIQLRDTLGNASGLDDGVVCFFDPERDGSVEILPTTAATEVGGGDAKSVKIAVTTRTTGRCFLQVHVCGHPVFGSPFTLHSTPGDACAARCVADAERVATVQPRELAILFVRTHDGLGHACLAGGAPVHASISPSGQNFGEILAVDDHGDGTYSVSFVAAICARYELAVMVGEHHIHRSPFVVHVTDSHSASTGEHIYRWNGGGGTRSSSRSASPLPFSPQPATRTSPTVAAGGGRGTAHRTHTSPLRARARSTPFSTAPVAVRLEPPLLRSGSPVSRTSTLSRPSSAAAWPPRAVWK
jgi:hypothetical protein